jgi:hypothetical protein
MTIVFSQINDPIRFDGTHYLLAVVPYRRQRSILSSSEDGGDTGTEGAFADTVIKELQLPNMTRSLRGDRRGIAGDLPNAKEL